MRFWARQRPSSQSVCGQEEHWPRNWHEELREGHHEGGTPRCIVELIDMTFTDRSGEAVLAEIMSHGAEFIAGDAYTKHLLGNLRSELKRSREEGKEDDSDNHR